ncbi:hypothetical protein TNCV_2767721 [Trichonephila clavipes]|nr:hypothetical protein TNCV_2767721 [Trichonephila clavipes]
MSPQEPLPEGTPTVLWTLVPITINGIIHANRQFFRNLQDYAYVKFNYIAFKVTDVCHIEHDNVAEYDTGANPQYVSIGINGFLGTAFTPRQSASSVECLANQGLHLARDEVSDWLDAQCSTLTALTLVPVRLDQQLSDHSTVDEIASGAADCRLTYTMANCPQRRLEKRGESRKKKRTRKRRKKSSEKTRAGRFRKRRGESQSFLFGDADQESETRMRKNALRTGRRQAVE